MNTLAKCHVIHLLGYKMGLLAHILSKQGEWMDQKAPPTAEPESPKDNICIDCNQDCSTKIDLRCHKHGICNGCLAKRGTQQPHNVLDCLLCRCKEHASYKDALLSKPPETRDESTTAEKVIVSEFFNGEMPGVWIFVDDSNIWIEAMKLQSRKKGFKTSQDHRVRIDIGKLADVVAGDRRVEQGVLYGSEPPPVDTVWKKVREKGWRVDSQRRSRITGKEKQVDTKLVAEVTRTAITTPLHERTTIVLVSGDADVIPALDEVIKEDRWKIEVYMWRRAIARDIKKYAAAHKDRVEIKHLDEYLGRVTFTNIKFAFKRGLKHKVKESGVVFLMKEKAFINRIPDKAWCNQLESIAQWPFQYYWFEVSKTKTNNLIVVFQEDKEAGKFDVTSFLTAVQPSSTDGDHSDKYNLPKVMAVHTFLEFSEREFGSDEKRMQQSNPILEQVGLYDQDDVYDGHENEKNWISDGEDKWSAVKYKSRLPRRPYSTPCPFKFNCRHGTGCLYTHTDEELQDFRKRKAGRGNPVRKVKQCTKFEAKKCLKLIQDCDFAHGVEDTWCLQCRTTGHCTENCPN